LRKIQLRQPLLVETAMGKHALALLAALDTACVNVDELGQASAELFQQHPDYAIITSFPGLADSTGARVLAEIGDDRSRFADARALKAYAGCAPITRASGRSISINHRNIKNNRLANVGWMWAFTAAANYEPAREHYRQRREHGDRHAAATCSTNSSASSTTASNTTRRSTKPRHSRHRYATRHSAPFLS
jgi:transposase